MSSNENGTRRMQPGASLLAGSGGTAQRLQLPLVPALPGARQQAGRKHDGSDVWGAMERKGVWVQWIGSGQEAADLSGAGLWVVQSAQPPHPAFPPPPLSRVNRRCAQ